MISDSFIVKYMEAVVNNKTESIVYSKEKQNAVEDYNPNLNYAYECNNDLKYMFLNEDK
jgi:hypothetical protein